MKDKKKVTTQNFLKILVIVLSVALSAFVYYWLITKVLKFLDVAASDVGGWSQIAGYTMIAFLVGIGFTLGKMVVHFFAGLLYGVWLHHSKLELLNGMSFYNRNRANKTPEPPTSWPFKN